MTEDGRSGEASGDRPRADHDIGRVTGILKGARHVANRDDVTQAEREDAVRVLSALASLSMSEQIMLSMTYVDSVAAPAAADILEIALSVFEERLSSAERALARAFAEAGF